MEMRIGDSLLFLRRELDNVGWLRVWLIGGCYLFKRSQEHPLTLR
jgi:hypothetical protein